MNAPHRLVPRQVSAEATQRPLRLLYLVHQFYPESRWGTERFVLQLARAMQQRGHQVQIVTYQLKHRRFDWRRLVMKLSQHQYRYEGIPVLGLRYTREPVNLSWLMHDETMTVFARRYLETWRPDIVHAGHPMRMTGFIQAAQTSGIPTIVTLTDYWMICPKYTLLNSRGEMCSGPAHGAVCAQDCPEIPLAFIQERLGEAEQLLRHMRCVVSPSRYLARVFQQELPWLAPQVIPHGIHPWTRNERRYAAGAPLVFAYAGSLRRAKGVHILIEAFRRVPSATARLRIYGSGRDGAGFRQQAVGDQRIEFCGSYTEKQAALVFAGMDVLVAPAVWPENHPFAVHEAIACNVPVVVSAAGGMTEAVRHGINGFCVPPGDPSALSRILQQVVDRPEQLNGLKVALAETPISTLEEEVAAYEDLYRIQKT